MTFIEAVEYARTTAWAVLEGIQAIWSQVPELVRTALPRHLVIDWPLTFNHGVAGSSPTALTNQINI